MMYDDELYSWYPNDNVQSSNIIREYRMIYITLLKYICYIFVGYKNQNSRFMRTPKLSIIIPVYNVASYIEESVYSLLNQTVIRDMEIILVEKWK